MRNATALIPEDSAPSALRSPRTRTRPPARVPRGRALLEAHLDLIQRKLRQLSWSGGLPESEVEEFRSWALLKLVDDDYRILGSWKGRSSFQTFLGVVLTNLLRDYRVHLWGKWRASAASRRSGPTGVLLERLLFRDGLSCSEAVERLRADHGIALSPDEVASLVASLPSRRQDRRDRYGVSEEELMQVAVEGGVEARILDWERNRTARQLRDLLAPLLRSLPAEDRLLLKLSFFDDLSMSAIAPVLGRPQREALRGAGPLPAGNPAVPRRGRPGLGGDRRASWARCRPTSAWKPSSRPSPPSTQN